MRFLAIAVKDVFITFRDKKALAIIIAMPLILIGILGASFGQMFKTSTDLGEFKVAIVDHDRGQIAQEFKAMFENQQLKELIKTELKTEEAAKKAVQDNKLVAAVIIPEDFTKKLKAGEKSQIEILADPGLGMKANILKGIIERFASGVSGITIGINTSIEQLKALGVSPKALPVYFPIVGKDLEARAEKPLIEVKSSNTEGKKEVSAFQYYSASMGVMFILFSGMFGIKSIIEERNNKTLMRIMTTSTSNASIITGKFLGMLLTGLLQVTIMILVTSLLFGVHWGDSYLGIGVMAITSVFASSGLSMFIASLAKTERSAEMMASIGIQVMSLIGGSMVPLYIFPEFLRTLSNITLNKWAILGFNNLMLDKSFDTVIQPSLVLLAIGTVFLIIGTWRLKLE